MSANPLVSETSLTDQAIAWLGSRVPRGWVIERRDVGPDGDELGAGSKLVLKGPNGTGITMAVEEKDSVPPRTVIGSLSPKVQTARKMGANLPLLLVAPWLSERTRSLLEGEEINYIDMTGNALIRIDNPPFYLQAAGAERNPKPKGRGRAQLRGAKAARLIRLLLDVRPPYGVQEIAEATGLAPGYVSRLLDTLYREALIERAPRGPVESVDIAGLLRRWAGTYDVFRANDASAFIAVEGLERLLARATESSDTWAGIAITGSFAAARIAPITSPALLLVYSDAPERLGRDLGLLPAAEGANVMLLRPFDPVAIARAQVVEGLSYAATSQVAVDCLSGNGRMPAEGEALLEWMQANESEWRLPSLQALYSSGGS